MIHMKFIRAFLLTSILLIGCMGQLSAQDFTTVPISDLSPGAVVKGIYLLESGVNTGLYLKEQSDGSISAATLDASDEHFYFWVSENPATRTFQIHSATTAGKAFMLNENGSAQLTDNLSTEESFLMFQMDESGPVRTSTDPSSVAIGSVITQVLDNYSGTADCECYGFSSGDQKLIVFHEMDYSQSQYTSPGFNKTNNSSAASVSQTDNYTRLQIPQETASQNFVSSLFFVNGFGINDFQLTAVSGTEGIVGFLDYTQNQFTSKVYDMATPKIGVKIADDKISLLYLAGNLELPDTQLNTGGEKETGFILGEPIQFGFEDQRTFAAVQNGDTIRMMTQLPADMFVNQTVTQSTRMLVSLDKGQVDLSYTMGNGLVNSQNDMGFNSGKDYVSTDYYLPYNKGKSYINTFDWQRPEWAVRYTVEDGTAEEIITSPFYSSDNAKSGISAKFNNAASAYLGGEDYMPTEGWELVKANLGYNLDGTVRDETPENPYMLFYDRVGATLRAFVYVNNDGEANQLDLTLGVRGGIPGPNNSEAGDYTPLLWGSLQQFTTLDTTLAGSYSKSVQFFSTKQRRWYFYDFAMDYDPCSEFFESSIELKLTKTTKGDLSLIGRLQGGIAPEGTAADSSWADERDNFLMGVMGNDYDELQNTLGDITFNQYEKYDAESFGTSITGELIGAKIPEWEIERARLEWETQTLDADRERTAIEEEAEGQIFDGLAGLIGTGLGAVAIAAGVPEPAVGLGLGALASLTTIAKGAITLNEERGITPSQQLANRKRLNYLNIIEKGKYDDQVINLPVPPPRPSIVFGELALKGSLKITTVLTEGEEFIATPGALNSDRAPEWRVNKSRGGAPMYNRPMGRYAMLNQPDFGIVVAYDGYDGDGDIMKAYLKTRQKPYFAINDKTLGKVADAFKIAINVKTSRSKGGSVNKVSKGYHNFFLDEFGGSLPGEMDISDLIDWDIIVANIADLNDGDKTEDNLAKAMKDWITVSYDVWALTMTNLKARNLEYVMASSNQYFNGASMFQMVTSDGQTTAYGLAQLAKDSAKASFSAYDFGDHEVFGTTYQVSNMHENFAAVMFAYCTERNRGFSPDTVNLRFPVSSPEIEKSMPETGLRVYPNPSNGLVNFELSTEAKGNTQIILYNFNGQVLVQSNMNTNGFETARGEIDISVLPSGIYILRMVLPDGTFFSEQIIRD